MLKETKTFRINEFFYSINRKKYISLVDKFGLQETTINNTQLTEIDIGIKELFILNCEGSVILTSSFAKNYVKNYDDYILKLRNIVVSLFSLNMNNHKSDVFSYQIIILNGLKLNILIKNYLVLVGVFQENLSPYYVKLYLLHMYVAFLNFNGDYFDTMKHNLLNNTNGNQRKPLKVGINLSENDSNSDNLNNGNTIYQYSKNDIFQLKIYETYFIKHITLHFDRVFKILIKNEEMYLSYIKFKNMYIIDLSTNVIIFDLLACRKSEKNIKIYKNDKIWQEILFHSRSLLESYKSENRMVYDKTDSNYRFVKLECTSTYPRLTFIIKFIPILNGISIVHIYSQKKLSRMAENSDNNVVMKNYKEIDILYGSDIKNNSNIEFRYSEPKKLQEIEKFFIEFYVSIRNNFDIFSDCNHELHYLDYSIISTINDILLNNKQNLNGSKNSIETILHKINVKLYENFINMQNGSENILKNNQNTNVIENTKRNTNNDNDNRENANGRDGSNFLKINKFNILKELFNTFEVFNKSGFENQNSKNSNSDNDGWIFKRDLNPKDITEDKLDFIPKKLNRLNSNLNSKIYKNEREHYEKNEFNKNDINTIHNQNYLDNSRNGLKKLKTNGSAINETIIDLKNKKCGNEMNTITLSRFDNNETLKYDNNQGKNLDFSMDSISLIGKEGDNSDSIIFNKITNNLKNEKSQSIDNLVDELFNEKEKFCPESKKPLKAKESDKNQRNLKKDDKDLNLEKNIKRNTLLRNENKDSKNHIFETDFPNDDLNKDVRLNNDLLALNDQNIIKGINLNHINTKQKEIEVDRNIFIKNFFDSEKPNDNFDKNEINEMKDHNNLLKDELKLNFHNKKQMSLIDNFKDKDKNVKSNKIYEKLVLKEDVEPLQNKANSQIGLVKVDKFTYVKHIQNLNDNLDKQISLDEPKIIRVEGKSNYKIKRPLMTNNDSINMLSENYETNNDLIVNEKLKENNYFKKKNSNTDKNKFLNKQNKFHDTSDKDLIY